LSPEIKHIVLEVSVPESNDVQTFYPSRQNSTTTSRDCPSLYSCPSAM